MADGTKIEWTEATWNPVTGCSLASPGCTNCYAMQLAGTRLAHHWSRKGLTQATKTGPVWTGEVRFNEEWLDQPLRWRRPRMIFVCAHGDLFHENVPDAWIDRVFAVMALCPQHTFQVLTKRSARMREYMDRACGRIGDAAMRLRKEDLAIKLGLGPNGLGPLPHAKPGREWWPLPNVWLGVSVEDQTRADQRIPDLLATPAAVRWISAEPLLGPVDLREVCGGHHFQNPLTGHRWHDAPEGVASTSDMGGARLDWIVCGGESGKDARPMHPDWARSLRDQCAAACVPFFFKQWGEWFPANPEAKCASATTTDRAVRDLSGGQLSLRVGKKAAGHLLDGVEHFAYPSGHTATPGMTPQAALVGSPRARSSARSDNESGAAGEEGAAADTPPAGSGQLP